MEDLRKQVMSMQHKIKDLLDEPGHAAARRLTSEVQGLEDDLQVTKNARSIEDRTKRIISLLQGEAKTARIMNYEHLDDLRQWFEGLRGKLQKLK